MYEVHAWCNVSENAYDGDSGTLESGIAELREKLAQIQWGSSVIDLQCVNGFWCLNVTLYPNRPRGDDGELDDLFAWVGERFPGSYGLIYDRNDELPEPDRNRFRVRVMARGKITEGEDPFLSPVAPVIED